MAISIFFPSEPHWYAGNHGFFPIIDRVRAAVPPAWIDLVEPLFETIDQGFGFLNLDEEVTLAAFSALYLVSVQEYRRCLGSEAEARMPKGYYKGIMQAWADLITRMEADPRSRSTDAPTAEIIN